MVPSLSPFKPVVVPCPACAATATDCLTNLSQSAHVDYFRCQLCGHVWNLPRALVDAPCDYEKKS